MLRTTAEDRLNQGIASEGNVLRIDFGTLYDGRLLRCGWSVDGRLVPKTTVR